MSIVEMATQEQWEKDKEAREKLEQKEAMEDRRMRYCFVCGKKAIFCYPGNDPECGPAEWQCPTFEHPNLDSVRMNAEVDLMADMTRLSNLMQQSIEDSIAYHDDTELTEKGKGIMGVWIALEILEKQFGDRLAILNAEEERELEARMMKWEGEED